MVGAIGFEPTTSWSQTRRATGLRYAPTVIRESQIIRGKGLGGQTLPAYFTRREVAAESGSPKNKAARRPL